MTPNKSYEDTTKSNQRNREFLPKGVIKEN